MSAPSSSGVWREAKYKRIYFKAFDDLAGAHTDIAGNLIETNLRSHVQA